jgi:hypothetical protein
MQLKEFNIILDIKKNIKQEQFEVVQGDSFTNLVNISLVDGLNAYDLSNTNVEIVFSKSDGTTVQQTDIAIINDIQGRIQCILKTNTIASPGKVVAEVRILNMDKLLTSTRFEFFVRKSLINDETIESTNEFPVLTQLINTTGGLIEQIEQIEKQVPEQVVTDLNAVSTLANQLQIDLATHKADKAPHSNIPTARVTHSATQSISTGGSGAALAFDTELFDNDIIHDNGIDNTRLTAKTAGKYIVGGCTSWASNTTGFRILRVRKNGVLVVDQILDGAADATGAKVQSINTLVELNVNDYVELVVLHTAGVSLNIEKQNEYSPLFYMVRVG